MSTTADKMTIANTILAQLGGHKFVVMTGARDILALECGLRFKLPSYFAADGINMVSIGLEPDDLYSVAFEHVRAGKRRIVARYAGIYGDQLPHIFTETTGLDTHL